MKEGDEMRRTGKMDEYSLMLIASGIMAAVVLAFVLFVVFRFTPTAPKADRATASVKITTVAYEI